MGDEVRVTLRFELGDDFDEVDRADALQRLHDELQTADADVEPVEEQAPAGTKSGGAILSAIAVAGGTTFVNAAVQQAFDWFKRERHPAPKLRIEGPDGFQLVLPNATPADVQKVVAQLVRDPAG